MIKARDLTYSYPQHRHGIGPVTFSVKPGEMLHVTGSSGCGKSTLARCISGLIPHIYNGVMGGEVFIDGRRTDDTPLWKLAETAGFVFQNPAMQMMGSSVEEEIIIGLENLGLSRDAIRKRLEDSLERFGLTRMRRHRPQTLSGGEQQKLALAAITARRPPLLVLDEPLSMLDVAAASELADHLSELARAGTTIILFEHRTDFLAGMPGLSVMPLDGGNTPGASAPQSRRRFGTAQSCRSPALSISGLTVKFGSVEVLKNFNCAIRGGAVTAVVGRNGTGKTTLLRAIAGLQKFEGTIAVDGGAPDFGQVFQNADLQLFNASVRAEVLYRVREPDMALYARLLRALGLERYENTPPLILSEGEKKRAALAAVLMRQPTHGVLLDEPSLGQDSAHKAMLVDLCRNVAAEGRMAVMTTHDLHLASMADRLILLGPHGITADGTPEAVFSDGAAWQRAGMFVPGWIRFRQDGITA